MTPIMVFVVTVASVAASGALFGGLIPATVMGVGVACIGWRAAASRRRLAATAFAFAFGIHLSNLVEAVVFRLGIPRHELLLMIASGAARAAWAAAAVALLPSSSSDRPALAPRSAAWWARRILASAILFTVVYLTAGAIAFPFISDFYTSRSLPPLSRVLALQLVRGAWLAGLIVLLSSAVHGSRLTRSLVAGAALALIGGIAPLVTSNAYMPDQVRNVHLWEVGVSYFVFGALAAGLFLAPTRESRAATSPTRTPQIAAPDRTAPRP